MVKVLLLFCCLLGVADAAFTQSLTKTERSIVKDVDAAMPATLALLEESVNINSGTYNITGVRNTGEVYARDLRAMGFKVEWISLPDSLRNAGHLVATRTGKKGKKLFLIGHLDTVFEPDMPANPFRMLNDSTATGQGVVDMKGGNVLVVAALKALHKRGLLDDVTITVYLTGDEENVGTHAAISRLDFIERAKKHDIALGFENAVNLNTVTTARRGFSEWKLEVEGVQGHSSAIFGTAGYGSIYEAARIINAFREKMVDEPFLSGNPGLFIGGSDVNYDHGVQSGHVSGKINIISPKTVVIGDMRFITEQQKQNARSMMRDIVSQHLPGSKATISFKDGFPAMPPTAGNEALVGILNEVSRSLGYGIVKATDPAVRGAGDISFVAEYLDCIDGLGASGKGGHAPGETINLKEYPSLIKRAAILIYRLTR